MSKSPDTTSVTRQVTFDTDLKHFSALAAEIELPVIGGKTEDTRSINSITFVESKAQSAQSVTPSAEEIAKTTKAKKTSILKKASEKGLKLSKNNNAELNATTAADQVNAKPPLSKNVKERTKKTKNTLDEDWKSLIGGLETDTTSGSAESDTKHKGSPKTNESPIGGLNLIRKALLAKEISATSLKRVIKSSPADDKSLPNNTDTGSVRESGLPVNNPPSETKLGVGSGKRAPQVGDNKNTVVVNVLASPTPIRIEKFDPKEKTDKTPAAVAKENSNSSIDRVNKTQEHKRGKMDNVNLRKRESYEAIYAERNTLYKAEATYRRRITQLEEEANGFLRTIEDISSENKLLRSNIDLLECDLKDNDVASILDKSLALEKEKIELENRVKHLEKLLNNEDTENETGEVKQKEIRELKAHIIKLQTENQSVNEENIKLKAENFQILKKLHGLEKENKQLINNSESGSLGISQDVQKEYSVLKQECQLWKDQHAEKEKKVNSLEYENQTLSESLTKKKKELDELLNAMKDENKFDNEIKYLKSQILSLEAEKKIAEETLDEYKVELEDAISTRDELKIKVDELQSEKHLYKTKFDASSVLTASQLAQIERMKGEVLDLMKDLELSQEMCERLKSDTDSSTVDLVTANMKTEELQTMVYEKEEKIKILETEISDYKTVKETENTKSREEITNLSEKVDRLTVVEAALHKMEQEMKHFVEKLEDSEITKKQIAMKLEDKGGEIANLEKQIFELHVKLDNMKQRICVLDREKRDMEDDKFSWEIKRDKFNDIESSNKRLTEENKRLRAVLEEARGGEPVALQQITPEPVPESWVGNGTPTKRSQRAIYVGRNAKKEDHERKKVLFNAESEFQKHRIPYSKSIPARPSKSHGHKKDHSKSNVALSRSWEDLSKRSPEPVSPARSTPTLPDVNREPRLTFGMGYSSSYATIHRNRIKAAGKHGVY